MRALLVVVVTLVGCGPARLPGAPEPGKACTNQVPECTTPVNVAYCQDSIWVEFGCSRCSNVQTPKCEGKINGAVLDTACHIEGGTACIGDALVICKRRTLPINSQYAWSTERDCAPGKCAERPGDVFVASCAP